MGIEMRNYSEEYNYRNVKTANLNMKVKFLIMLIMMNVRRVGDMKENSRQQNMKKKLMRVRNICGSEIEVNHDLNSYGFNMDESSQQIDLSSQSYPAAEKETATSDDQSPKNAKINVIVAARKNQGGRSWFALKLQQLKKDESRAYQETVFNEMEENEREEAEMNQIQVKTRVLTMAVLILFRKRKKLSLKNCREDLTSMPSFYSSPLPEGSEGNKAGSSSTKSRNKSMRSPSESGSISSPPPTKSSNTPETTRKNETLTENSSDEEKDYSMQKLEHQ
ncbi:hypothetical protein ACFE04_030116 [Oxalis oulophora]